MKTILDPVQVLYVFLKGSELDTAASGNLYALKRPNSSTLEDIVVNAIDIGDGSAQRATGNVNIYVPNLSVKIGGKMQDMPDTARIKVLSDIAVEMLSEHSDTKYNFWLVNQTVFEEPDIQQHYINLRIDFKFHNSN